MARSGPFARLYLSVAAERNPQHVRTRCVSVEWCLQQKATRRRANGPGHGTEEVTSMQVEGNTEPGLRLINGAALSEEEIAVREHAALVRFSDGLREVAQALPAES